MAFDYECVALIFQRSHLLSNKIVCSEMRISVYLEFVFAGNFVRVLIKVATHKNPAAEKLSFALWNNTETSVKNSGWKIYSK